MDAQHLHQLMVFVNIVREGTMTAAARKLGLSKSVVSAHLKGLEGRLEVRLLERTTRKMRLTQVGERVYEAALRMMEAGEAALSEAAAERGEVRGVLRLACPVELADTVMISALESLYKAHPALRVELEVGDRLLDLIEEGIDVALRVGAPLDSSYVMRTLFEDDEILVGAPTPYGHLLGDEAFALLEKARWLSHPAVEQHFPQQMTHRLGQKRALRMPASSLAAGHTGVLKRMACAGHGVLIIPRFMVEEELTRGSLAHLLPDWRLRRVKVYALMPPRPWPRRTQAFLEIVGA